MNKMFLLVLFTFVFLIGCSDHSKYTKYGTEPVYGDETTGTIFDPFVYTQNDSIIMVVSERKTGNIIRLASIDGIHWNKTNTILICRPGTWEHIVNRACVIYSDTIWHMWYTGQSPEVAHIGHAISNDGYTFFRDSCEVITPTLESEGVSVMNPCVIYNKQKHLLQMWYAAGENYEPDVLFYAESLDGKYWVKNECPILTNYPPHSWERAKVGGCDVKLQADGSYEMYYIGYQDVHTARICYATSKDGLTWDRTDNNILIEPTKGSWDSEATYKPALIRWKGKDMLYYNGRTGNKEYIGLALGNDSR